MSEKLHEQISALVDNEIHDPELLIRQICKDSSLQERWHRYHIMHDVMTNQADDPKINITQRVSQALEDEPELHTIIKTSRPSRLKPVMKQAAGLAIAATVSAVAVITVQQQTSNTSSPSQEIAAAHPPVAPVAHAQVRFVNEPVQLDQKVQSKLGNYLVNHNEYAITSNMQGVLPYTRVVTTPGQRVVVRSINEK